MQGLALGDDPGKHRKGNGKQEAERKETNEGCVIKQVTAVDSWGLLSPVTPGESVNTHLQVIPPQREGTWGTYTHTPITHGWRAAPGDI